MEVGFANPSEESQQHIHATLFSHHGQNLGEHCLVKIHHLSGTHMTQSNTGRPWKTTAKPQWSKVWRRCRLSLKISKRVILCTNSYALKESSWIYNSILNIWGKKKSGFPNWPKWILLLNETHQNFHNDLVPEILHWRALPLWSRG